MATMNIADADVLDQQLPTSTEISMKLSSSTTSRGAPRSGHASIDGLNHSDDFVRSVRIRFREQAARFLEDVSFDVGAVLSRDADIQDDETKLRLFELQKGLTDQVQHMNKVIKREKHTINAAANKKKEIKFTTTEMKTLQDIATKEEDANGVVTTFLRRRDEGAAKSRYHEFVKKAEKKYFEHRRCGNDAKFDFRDMIQASMGATASGSARRLAKVSASKTTADRSTKPISAASAATPPPTSPVQQRAVSPVFAASTGEHDQSARSDSIGPVVEPIQPGPGAFAARFAEGLDSNEIVGQVLHELVETVEELVEFDWQTTFQTEVPPRLYDEWRDRADERREGESIAPEGETDSSGPERSEPADRDSPREPAPHIENDGGGEDHGRVDTEHDEPDDNDDDDDDAFDGDHQQVGRTTAVDDDDDNDDARSSSSSSSCSSDRDVDDPEFVAPLHDDDEPVEEQGSAAAAAATCTAAPRVGSVTPDQLKPVRVTKGPLPDATPFLLAGRSPSRSQVGRASPMLRMRTQAPLSNPARHGPARPAPDGQLPAIANGAGVTLAATPTADPARTRPGRDRATREKFPLSRSRSPWRHPDWFAHRRHGRQVVRTKRVKQKDALPNEAKRSTTTASIQGQRQQQQQRQGKDQELAGQ